MIEIMLTIIRKLRLGWGTEAQQKKVKIRKSIYIKF